MVYVPGDTERFIVNVVDLDFSYSGIVGCSDFGLEEFAELVASICLASTWVAGDC